jgi:DNA-binding CsgD family transcriptional regulator
MLFNRNQIVKKKKSKVENKNLLLEKENLLLRNQQLRTDVEFKSKELATSVMYLVQKNEFITSMVQKLLNFTPVSKEEKTWLESIIKEVKQHIDNSTWGEFEIRFQQVHENFYIRLRKRFPDLTPNEEKLCAFLKLNMSTKEISSITFQSVKSIEVARTRLRKKLYLSRDENLVSFLKQL